MRLILLITAAILAHTPAALAETFIGPIVGVTDGDTVKLFDGQQHKIRLQGIDAPEMR